MKHSAFEDDYKLEQELYGKEGPYLGPDFDDEDAKDEYYRWLEEEYDLGNEEKAKKDFNDPEVTFEDYQSYQEDMKALGEPSWTQEEMDAMDAYYEAHKDEFEFEDDEDDYDFPDARDLDFNRKVEKGLIDDVTAEIARDLAFLREEREAKEEERAFEDELGKAFENEVPEMEEDEPEDEAEDDGFEFGL